MEHSRSVSLLLLLLLPSGVFAQEAADVDGVQWGGMDIRPATSVLEAYDNRVQFDENSGESTSDFYTEAMAAIALSNLSARYNLSAQAGYGYRFYSDNIELNDDFYNVGGVIGADQNLFKWGLSADVIKSLNYNTTYDL